jgi:hypothetical protein
MNKHALRFLLPAALAVVLLAGSADNAYAQALAGGGGGVIFGDWYHIDGVSAEGTKNFCSVGSPPPDKPGPRLMLMGMAGRGWIVAVMHDSIAPTYKTTLTILVGLESFSIPAQVAPKGAGGPIADLPRYKLLAALRKEDNVSWSYGDQTGTTSGSGAGAAISALARCVQTLAPSAKPPPAPPAN